MKFKTGLKGFLSILFGVIVIAALVVGTLYLAGIISFGGSSEEDACDTENCIVNEGGSTNEGGDPNPDEAINLTDSYTYYINID